MTVGNALIPITSRFFAEGDLAALYAVEEVCFAPPLRFSRSLMRALANDPNGRTWIGIVDNIRAGFAMVGLRGEKSREMGTAYLWTIEVLPAFRRMGVARHLMMRVEESAREARCGALELHVSERNAYAAALYESRGFVRVGIEEEFYGRGESAVRYRLVLQG